MVTDDGDQGGPSRRDFLKASGVGALTMAVAGCDELPEEGEDGGSSNETDGGGPGTGTPGGDGGGGSRDDPFVATPAAVGEGFAQEVEDDLVRSTFLDERYTRIEGGIPGFDVPDEVTPVGHAATYGHDMQLPGGGEAESPPTLHTLSAGFLSLPNPDVEGAPTNPYAERPLSELVRAPEGNLPLAAAGLGPTVEWLNDPASVERTEADVEFVEGTMTVETFVGPVAAEPGRGMPDPEADGFLDDGATGPVPQMMTVHTARGFVGGSVVIVGMINGWRRPPTMGPPPTEIGPELSETLADIYEKIVKAELFRRALGEAGMLLAAARCDPDETGPPPDEAERTVEYSDYYGLRPEARIELGYPEEQRLTTTTSITELVGRTAPGPFFDCEEYDPEVHDPGEWVTLNFEQRMSIYTLDEEGAVRFGVVASPRAELEGEEQNPLAGDSLDPSRFSEYWGGVWSLINQFSVVGDTDWGYTDPTEVESFSQLHIEGRDTQAKGFEGTLGYVPDDAEGTSAYVYLARLTTPSEVVVACAFSTDTGESGFFDSQEAISRVFRDAASDVVEDPGEIGEWVDGSVDDLNLVQICRNTRLETGSGDVLHQGDPQLVQGRNAAAPFDASTFAGTTQSSRQLEYGVFQFDLANRSGDPFETILPSGDLDELDGNSTDPDVLFDRNATDSDPANDLPVFELQGSDSALDLSFHAPSGYVHDVATLEEGSDYDLTGFDVLRVGVTYVVDPDGGQNYGDGNGYPSRYDDSVRAIFEYLKRTYPTGLAVFRANDGIRGATKFLSKDAAKNEKIDYRNARVALERMAKPGNNNWSYDGDTLTHQVSESAADSGIRSNGFDVWVLIVPNGYYGWHRGNSGIMGLASWSDRLAVTTKDGSGQPGGPAGAGETCAQEIGHQLVAEPYKRPTSGNGESNPLAQRDSDGTETGNRDFDHARHLSSDENSSTPDDGPGVVSRVYSLAEGQFTVPSGFQWSGGFSVTGISNNPTLGSNYGPTSSSQRLGRVESYMSYSNRDNWADSLLTQDVLNGDLNRAAGNYRTMKLGGVTDLGTVLSEGESTSDGEETEAPSVKDTDVAEDYVTEMDEWRLARARRIVTVSVLGPEGTTIAEKRVPGALGVDGHDVDETRLDGIPFDVELPPEAVDVVLTSDDAATDLRFNPVTRPIRDAYGRLPEDALGEGFDREDLQELLDGVDTDMDEGDFGAARDRLTTFAEQRLAGSIDPEFEPLANEPNEARMRALFDEMIGRMDGLASDGGGGDDEIPVGEAPPWTDWVPKPADLPVFADARGLWQYDAASVLESGGIDEKVALEDPMANPFLAGFFATAFWQQLGALGLGEAVVGPAAVQTDVDPAEVPLETGAFFGNVQLYLGDFDVDALDTAVSEGPFSESDTPGVYVHDQSEFAVAYDATYVVLASTVDEVVTILETGAGERDRWYEVNDEVEWLYEAGATGEFSVVVHRESGTIPDESDDRATFSPFTAANGLAQSAWLDGETFTRARTALVYPSEDAVELSVLRETLGVDAVDRSIDRNGRFVQVQATYTG